MAVVLDANEVLGIAVVVALGFVLVCVPLTTKYPSPAKQQSSAAFPLPEHQLPSSQGVTVTSENCASGPSRDLSVLLSRLEFRVRFIQTCAIQEELYTSRISPCRIRTAFAPVNSTACIVAETIWQADISITMYITAHAELCLQVARGVVFVLVSGVDHGISVCAIRCEARCGACFGKDEQGRKTECKY
jgi:hypothetical protein